MAIGASLTKIAGQIVEHLESRAPALKQELIEIEERKLAIERELNAADLAQKRLLNFRPMLGANYQCPSCWVWHEQTSSLYPIGGGTRTEDHFRCSVCHETITISF